MDRLVAETVRAPNVPIRFTVISSANFDPAGLGCRRRLAGASSEPLWQVDTARDRGGRQAYRVISGTRQRSHASGCRVWCVLCRSLRCPAGTGKVVSSGRKPPRRLPSRCMLELRSGDLYRETKTVSHLHHHRRNVRGSTGGMEKWTDRTMFTAAISNKEEREACIS